MQERCGHSWNVGCEDDIERHECGLEMDHDGMHVCGGEGCGAMLPTVPRLVEGKIIVTGFKRYRLHATEKEL